MSSITRKFFSGVGSVLDLWPAPRNTRVMEAIEFDRTDSQALLQDWVKVSADYAKAFEQVTNELGPVHVEEK